MFFKKSLFLFFFRLNVAFHLLVVCMIICQCGMHLSE